MLPPQRAREKPFGTKVGSYCDTSPLPAGFVQNPGLGSGRSPERCGGSETLMLGRLFQINCVMGGCGGSRRRGVFLRMLEAQHLNNPADALRLHDRLIDCFPQRSNPAFRGRSMKLPRQCWIHFNFRSILSSQVMIHNINYTAYMKQPRRDYAIVHTLQIST